MKIKRYLEKKAEQFLNGRRSIRDNKTKNIFDKRYYIFPENIIVKNYHKKPIAVFNPGALLKDDKLKVFPRLIFDYYKYTSSVGCFEVEIGRILKGILDKNFETKIILYPEFLWEFLGIEDPRVIENNEEILMLYTGKGYVDFNKKRRDVLSFAKLDKDFKIKRKDYFKISDRNEFFLPETIKDSAFLDFKEGNVSLLTRIQLKDKFFCWRGIANINKLTIDPESLHPVFAMEEWETKVGWSTNTIKLSNDEYLVGWHAVMKNDLSYKNGFAIVNGKGELLGISDYLLYPEGLTENYGDRAFVIFGNGLVKYEDYIIWIGGISDYGIGIFITTLKDIMENIRII
ncbi:MULTISPECIES: hypothetical protein [unclassified Marinitoga]|uniref:glycoside hydrolase family 130 protein n=1 Tax=unclassified Marinitoga TaxID=2640159 RepID=UPI000640BC11|nr:MULTISPECIES: hypothetical protein [unclassified Marinitoga]KLO24598.1 glycosidase [Marinitoga sp. 1155]NUU98874.1 hypothetical protein [Marinitoga sp. 1154]